MKVVILAGGRGSRLSELTKKIPKPMVKINNIPILIYIMKHYSKYGFKDFVIASGYKKSIIKKYFKKKILDWKIDVVSTGLDSQTGGRIKRLSKYLGNETSYTCPAKIPKEIDKINYLLQRLMSA